MTVIMNHLFIKNNVIYI